MPEPRFTLRDVEPTDVDVYTRFRCDPVMMAELGGPRPAEEIPAKVAQDVETARSGQGWILMVVPEGSDDVAGSVVLWSNAGHGHPYSEIGWMVLPEHQGRGLAKAAVRRVLDRARDDGRWGLVHAYPGVANGPSNGVCRSLGFTLLGQETINFADTAFAANHWVVDPRG